MKTQFTRSMATKMTKVVRHLLARLHLRPGQYAQFWAWPPPSKRLRSLPYLFVLTVLILLPLSAAAANLQTATRSVALGLPSSADWVAGADKFDSGMGDTATSAGDVNGDGYADLLVGAPAYRGVSGSHDGRAYLFLGSASGLSATPAWTIQGGNDCHTYYCNIGRGIGAAGDVNGDGYDDVIVAANRWSNGQTDEGRAFVYYGSANGLAATPNWSVESNQAYAYLGWIAGTAGDVNGDGYADILIGAGGFDGYKGRAFLFLGSPTGLSCGAGCPVDASSAAAWKIDSDQVGAELGWPAGAAGDVNGDGYDDVLVGAQKYDSAAFVDEGRVWVYLGSPSGLSSTAAWSVAGGQTSAQLGPGSGAAGDVNGDGYDDLLVAAHLYDNGQSDEGRVWLYLGSTTGLATTPVWSAEGDQNGAYLGYAHSSRVAGDLNGDGYADAIIGAYGYDNGQTDEGRAFLYMGSPAGLTVAPVWSAESNQPSALFGMAAGTAADVNGDGYHDLFAGAPQYDLAFTDSGATFVYYSHPPTAEAGGPYTVVADGAIQLDGSGSFGYSAGDTLVYTWDLDGDGSYGESGPAATRGDEIGVTPTFSAVGLQAPLTLTVKLGVTDQGGFSANDEAAVSVIDTTPPVITPAISGALGNSGWYVSDVSVQWAVSDAESAVSSTSGCDATTINTDSAGVTLTCSATSAGGSGSQSVIVQRDVTAPVITLVSRTPANGNGWNNGTVTTEWGCSDMTSDVVSASVSHTLSGEGANQSTTGTCTDNAGNSATDTQADINIDKSAPTISAAATSSPNGAGWYNSAVTVHFTCADALSGVASCPADEVLSSEGNAVAATAQTISDLAGNNSAPSNVVTVPIDKSAPVVTVTGVSNGALYALGSVPTAGCTTNDPLSGVATPATLSITGGNADGTGTFAATCSGASDNAGNAAPVVSATYQVIYNWAGFLPPVDNPPVVNSVNAGQAIPVKFSLGGDFGLNIFASGYPMVQSLACGSTGKSSDASEEAVTAGNSNLQYDPSTQTYLYRWKTDKAWAGACRQLIVKLIDGTEHRALFRFQGKTPGAREGEDEFATDVTPHIFLPLVSR